MKLGVNTFIWSAEFTPAHLSLLPRIKEHGFDGVEVPLFDPVALSRRRHPQPAWPPTGSSARSARSFPDGRSLISEDADVRRRSRQHLRDAIEATAEAGAGSSTARSTAPSDTFRDAAALAMNGSGRLRAINP